MFVIIDTDLTGDALLWHFNGCSPIQIQKSSYGTFALEQDIGDDRGSVKMRVDLFSDVNLRDQIEALRHESSYPIPPIDYDHSTFHFKMDNGLETPAKPISSN